MRKPGQKGDKKNRVRKKKNEKTGLEGNEKTGLEEMRENRFVKNGNEINR